MAKSKVEAGRAYGRLKAVQRDVSRPEGHSWWICQCDCGGLACVRGDYLTESRRKACFDCEPQPRDRMGAKGFSKRGGRMKHPQMYYLWWRMRRRCHNPKDEMYYNYGGRGIYVCERWLTSFDAFLDDMGDKPPGRSLDRIDNNGPYAPENCRWATPKEQCNNRRPRSEWTTPKRKPA